jgi:hypothetical protein
VAVAATDPDRAARLAADAERTAQSSITAKDSKALELVVSIANVYAVDDPDHAERFAQSVTAPIAKVAALVEIAETLDKG